MLAIRFMDTRVVRARGRIIYRTVGHFDAIRTNSIFAMAQRAEALRASGVDVITLAW